MFLYFFISDLYQTWPHDAPCGREKSYLHWVPLGVRIAYFRDFRYDVIEMAIEINPSVVITGDMKSDLFNTQNNKLSEIMTLFNLKNVINKPTRITARVQY
jgi:hypothetical protein